jgi:aminomethyltransferase
MGLRPEGRRIPRHGAKVIVDGAEIGEVTSGGHSPCLNAPIALAYLNAAHARRGAEVRVDLGKSTCAARVVRPPFYPERSD